VGPPPATSAPGPGCAARGWATRSRPPSCALSPSRRARSTRGRTCLCGSTRSRCGAPTRPTGRVPRHRFARNAREPAPPLRLPTAEAGKASPLGPRGQRCRLQRIAHARARCAAQATAGSFNWDARAKNTIVDKESFGHAEVSAVVAACDASELADGAGPTGCGADSRGPAPLSAKRLRSQLSVRPIRLWPFHKKSCKEWRKGLSTLVPHPVDPFVTHRPSQRTTWRHYINRACACRSARLRSRRCRRARRHSIWSCSTSSSSSSSTGSTRRRGLPACLPHNAQPLLPSAAAAGEVIASKAAGAERTHLPSRTRPTLRGTGDGRMGREGFGTCAPSRSCFGRGLSRWRNGANSATRRASSSGPSLRLDD
jgi:hypothetical protein